jgi:hypothetical protein
MEKTGKLDSSRYGLHQQKVIRWHPFQGASIGRLLNVMDELDLREAM